MSYKIWMHRRNLDEIESKVFELESKDHLKIWHAENTGWYESKLDVPKNEELPGKAENTETLEDANSLKLPPDKVSKIVRLLNGEKIGNRMGLSLTSFAGLFGISYNDRAGQARLKPKFNALVKKLQDNNEIYKTNKVWIYKGKKTKAGTSLQGYR